MSLLDPLSVDATLLSIPAWSRPLARHAAAIVPLICLGAPVTPRGQVRQMLIPRTFVRRPANTGQISREFDSPSAERREKDVKDDLSLRLKTICNHLSKADFATLVGDMTREQLRGERIPGRKASPC